MIILVKRTSWLLIVIFTFAFLIRFLSVWPANTIIGFDQARDLFDAQKIIAGDLRIIGPTAGNNPDLHHGVAFLYFLIPPLVLGGGNPIWAVLWNSLFNAAASLVVFFLAKSLFKSKPIGYLAAILTAFSFYYVEFSGWLSNPTVTLFTVPLFFLGLWEYFQGRKRFLPLSLFFLGLSIQFELFFIYLIPTGIIIWLILQPKFPKPKLILISLLSFLVPTSTMILTEVKFRFAGIKSLLSAGSFVGGSQKVDFLKFFSLDLFPQNKGLDFALGILATGFFVYQAITSPKTRKRNLFLLFWLFSPALMLILGSHNAPWFLIGRPAAAIIMGSYLIFKIRPKFLIIPIVGFFIYANCLAIKTDYQKGQSLLEPDKAAILSKQIAVMEYTYQFAQGERFAIDTVTNPLYINAVWAWNYDWYAKKFGFKPTWLGGDQIPPYNTLEKATGKEKYLFLIIDTSPRIPPIYTQNAIKTLSKKANFVEKKDFDGILVQQYRTRF